MAGLVPATSRLPSLACILCSSSTVKFFGGFLTRTRAYLRTRSSLTTNTAAMRQFTQYAVSQYITMVYAPIQAPHDRRRVAIAMLSHCDCYVIALRSLCYRTAKAMLSRLESYGIAPRKLWYLAPARQKPRFRPRFFAPSSPFRRFPIAGMRQKPNTLLSSIFLIFNISRCVALS